MPIFQIGMFAHKSFLAKMIILLVIAKSFNKVAFFDVMN